MALTPVEIRHVTLSRGLLGYKRGPTETLLEEVIESFEDVWRDRADLAEKVERLEDDLVRFRELEALLRATLVSAERTAAELKDQARREADLILGEAHAEARAITRTALGERERLQNEARRLRSQLSAALAIVEPAAPTEPAKAAPAKAQAA
jgi:cell division initiation protein